jgi:hypothetical protein
MASFIVCIFQRTSPGFGTAEIETASISIESVIYYLPLPFLCQFVEFTRVIKDVAKDLV